MSRFIASVSWAFVFFVCSAAFAQVLTQPVPVDHPPAVYPPEEIPKRTHVDVIVLVTVDVDGHVEKPAVQTSGGKDFDDAAIEAVKKWHFTPASADGVPIRARIPVAFHFEPPPPPAPEPAPTPTSSAAPASRGAPAASRGAPAPERGAPAPERGAPAPERGAPAAKRGAPAAKRGAPAGNPPENANPETSTAAVEEITVVGKQEKPILGASDLRIRLDHLAEVPRKNASDILTFAPGILLTNEGGEGHAEQVFLRGFDAREGQDIEFTMNGVPINESGNLHGNGYADTHFILPELVESLRVVEGPFDPSQGNYAVAGSADYVLGLEKRGFTAKYTIGSYGTNRALLLWGPANESPRTFAGAELYTTNGFGENRDAKRATAMGQYEGSLGGKSSFRVGATAYATSYHEAGVLREDDYDAGRIGFYDTYDPQQGGEDSRYSIYADIESRKDDTTFDQLIYVIDRGMNLREDFTGFLLDEQTPLQEPHGQRGDLIELEMSEQTIGAKGSARFRAKVLDLWQELTIGYDARGDHVDGQQYRIENATGHPYHLDTSLTSKIGDIGMYADVGIRPVKYLTLRGGVRGDLFAYDVTNNCAVQSVAHPSETSPPGDASCLSQEDFGAYREPVQEATTASIAALPRGTVLVGPWENFTLSASAGKGVRSIDPSYITQDVATPFANIVAYEGGMTYAGGLLGGALVARSIFFQTKVDKDLIFSETEGRNVLGGGTTRTGWVVAGRFTGDHEDISANATFVKSTFDDTGLLVPYVPDVVVRGDASVFGDLPSVRLKESPIRAALSGGTTFVGHRALPYGQRSDTIFTVDGNATLGWKMLELGLAVTNIFGEKYRLGEYNYASNFAPLTPGVSPTAQSTLVPVRHFTAGAPREIFGTLALHFGGT